jgi:4'-phosphopantetheinyl transferase
VAGVELWTCELARSAVDVKGMERMLSEPELARAARFGRPELRDRYVVGRATLRSILAALLGSEASRVAIARGARGRPFVQGSAIDFNVSHTRGTALFGVARSGRIGVDVEHRDRELNVEGVARKFMSPAEQAKLGTLVGDARRQALLRLWTCKEAMSKATGDALSAPFRRLDVTLTPRVALRDGPSPYDPAHWSLWAIDMAGGHLATVALWHAPPSA